MKFLMAAGALLLLGAISTSRGCETAPTPEVQLSTGLDNGTVS